MQTDEKTIRNKTHVETHQNHLTTEASRNECAKWPNNRDRVREGRGKREERERERENGDNKRERSDREMQTILHEHITQNRNNGQSSKHKFSPPLRIDGQGSYLFHKARQDKNPIVTKPAKVFIRQRCEPQEFCCHHMRTSLIKVMSMSWQPMETVFPACTIANDGSK